MRYGYCRLCGEWRRLELHHVFGGCYRKKSETYGMVILICRECHDKLHFAPDSAERMRKLRARYQAIFERRYPNLSFLKVFGRNWGDDEEPMEEGIDIEEMRIDEGK